MNDPIGKRWTPRNPLGVIALFVFLIETIATVSLREVAGTPFVAVFVWFIVLYPVGIALFFFFILWFKREALFGPMDFSDPGEFSRLLQKVEHIEAKQAVARIERDTSLDDVLPAVDKLLDSKDTWSAIDAAREFLTKGEYQKSLKLLEHIANRVGSSDPSYFRLLANIAYSQIGLGRYADAIENLLKVKNTRRDRNFGPGHALALAYAYLKMNDDTESQKWMDAFRQMRFDNVDWALFERLYPELAPQLKVLATSQEPA